MSISMILSVVAVLTSYLATQNTTIVYPTPVLEEAIAVVFPEEKVQLRPELVPICACESGDGTPGSARQFNADGTVVRGKVNPLDIGMCQVNLKYHGDAAEKMGYDLFTEEGNILYSNWLYSKQGAKPWGWSAGCHGRY